MRPTSEITAVLCPSPPSVRLLVMQSSDEILRARFGLNPPRHPRAVATLLEGLALWYQHPLRVVLSAAAHAPGSEWGLLDAFGMSEPSVHYAIEVSTQTALRGQRIGGAGDFADLRRLTLPRGAR